MEPFEICMLVFGIVIVCLLVTVLVLLIVKKSKNGNKEEIRLAVSESLSTLSVAILDNIERTNNHFVEKLEKEVLSLKGEMEKLNEKNSDNYIKLIEKLQASLAEMTKSVREENEKATANLNERFEVFSKNMGEKYAQIEKSVDKSLAELRRENTEKLSSIQQAVDEKLQKTLDDRLKASFESVVSQIGNVNKAIGEIKSIASDVGSLKNTLTNVKTKGIVGEVILSKMLEEILASSQYDVNVATKRGSQERVEYAIKMPSGNDGEFIYLPLDAKFPLESYNKIKEAIELGDKALLDTSRKELRSKLLIFAKDISTKYIDVPNTTDFAVMFLPTEGLYIEAIESGVFEEVQNKYKINIVGPSTLYAFLNALRSGFNSLAIQKHSSEVFELLEAVKTEFEKFALALASAQKKVDQAGSEIEALVGTRARQMQRKLKGVSSISFDEAEKRLELEGLSSIEE